MSINNRLLIFSLAWLYGISANAMILGGSEPIKNKSILKRGSTRANSIPSDFNGTWKGTCSNLPEISEFKFEVKNNFVRFQSDTGVNYYYINSENELINTMVFGKTDKTTTLSWDESKSTLNITVIDKYTNIPSDNSGFFETHVSSFGETLKVDGNTMHTEGYSNNGHISYFTCIYTREN